MKKQLYFLLFLQICFSIHIHGMELEEAELFGNLSPEVCFSIEQFIGPQLWFNTSKLKHAEWINSAQFCKDNEEYVVTASDDKTACIWNASNGQRLYRFEHQKKVNNARINPGTNHLLTLEDYSSTYVWDIESQKCLLSQTCTETQKEGTSDCTFLYCDKEALAVYCSINGQVSLWDMEQRALLKTFNHPVEIEGVFLSETKRFLLTHGDSSIVYVWDINQGKLLFSLQHTAKVLSAYFNKAENYILTSSDNNQAHVWSKTTGNLISSFSHKEWISCIYCSPTNSHIFTSCLDGNAYMWNILTGDLVHTFPHKKAVWKIALDKKKSFILTASDDGFVRLWNLHTGNCLHVFSHNKAVKSVCFSPSQKYILTKSQNKAAYVWVQYMYWKFDQLFLYVLLWKWLCVRKTNKNIKNTDDFIKTIPIEACFQTHEQLLIIWKSFPEIVQKAIWEKIDRVIQQYGKEPVLEQ